MARYIKANPKVAKYLHLENDRLQLKDGNYILWQGDMTAFGPLPMLNDTLAQIGGIALMPHEAKQEQGGTVTRPLPVATDERFVMDEPEPAEGAAPEAVTDGEGQAPASNEGEDENENQPSDPEPQTEDEGSGDTDEPEPEATDEPEDEGDNESETDNENPENEEE